MLPYKVLFSILLLGIALVGRLLTKAIPNKRNYIGGEQMNFVGKILFALLMLSLANIYFDNQAPDQKTKEINELNNQMDSERIRNMERSYVDDTPEGAYGQQGFPWHRANQMEVDEWIRGYVSRGGDEKRFAGANASDGWYVVEEDFSLDDSDLVTDKGFYWDGNIRHIIIPSRVNYLGGLIKYAVTFHSMKNFSLIGTTSK